VSQSGAPRVDNAVRRLTIDLDELETAWTTDQAGIRSFLDLESGRVVTLTEDADWTLDELGDDGRADDDAAFEAALREAGLPDWLAEMARDARDVERGLGERFIAVPTREPRDDYTDMQAFIDTLGDPRLRHRLQDALQQSHPFRRFREVLSRGTDELADWHRFHDARNRERLIAWLAELGIQPVAADAAPETQA
jgi:uncharacterized protein UPF0158